MAAGPSTHVLRRLLEGEDVPRPEWTSPGNSPNHTQTTQVAHYLGTGDPSHIKPGHWTGPGGTLSIEAIGGYAISPLECGLAAVDRAQELGHAHVVETLTTFMEAYLSLLSLFLTVPLERNGLSRPKGFRALIGDRCGSKVPHRKNRDQTSVVLALMAAHGKVPGIPSIGGSRWWDNGVGAWAMRRMLHAGKRVPRIPLDFDGRLALARTAGLYGSLIYVLTDRGFYAFVRKARGWDHWHPAIKVVNGAYSYISPREKGLPAWNILGDDGRTEEIPGRQIRAWQRVARGTKWETKKPVDWSDALSIRNVGRPLGRWDLRSPPYPSWKFEARDGQPSPPPPPPPPEEEEPVFKLNPDDLKATDWDAVTGATKLAGLTALRVLADRDDRARKVWKRIEPQILKAREETP